LATPGEAVICKFQDGARRPGESPGTWRTSVEDASRSARQRGIWFGGQKFVEK
jgi:hypothetical protein